MRRLNILIWHIHGSYLNTLARIEHNWYLPTKPGLPEGYGGRGPTFNLPEYVCEVPAEQVRDLKLDLVIYQSPKNYVEDQFELLTSEQRRLPKIYLLIASAWRPKPSVVLAISHTGICIAFSQITVSCSVQFAIQVCHWL